VNEDGVYMEAAGPHLAGKEVLAGGNKRGNRWWPWLMTIGISKVAPLKW